MKRQPLALGCVFALGMAVAFPAGLLLGGGGSQNSAPGRQPAGEFRQVFTPSVLRDPAFIEQQRRNAEQLEQSCSQTGEFCVEARAMQRWLIENAQ